MKRVLLGCLLFLLVGSAAALGLDDGALKTYKAFRSELVTCFGSDDYYLTWKKYASSERLEELDSEQNRLSNFRKATLFDSYRLAIFAVSELEIVSSKQAKDGSVKIKYQNRSFPDTNGEAVLLKEDNLWKINSDSLFPALE